MLACLARPTDARKKFLYHFKAGPAGGRLRRPSSRRQHLDGFTGSRAGLTSATDRHRSGATYLANVESSQ
jgi:hypothetical protein